MKSSLFWSATFPLGKETFGFLKVFVLQIDLNPDTYKFTRSIDICKSTNQKFPYQEAASKKMFSITS